MNINLRVPPILVAPYAIINRPYSLRFREILDLDDHPSATGTPKDDLFRFGLYSKRSNTFFIITLIVAFIEPSLTFTMY